MVTELAFVEQGIRQLLHRRQLGAGRIKRHAEHAVGQHLVAHLIAQVALQPGIGLGEGADEDGLVIFQLIARLLQANDLVVQHQADDHVGVRRLDLQERGHEVLPLHVQRHLGDDVEAHVLHALLEILVDLLAAFVIGIGQRHLLHRDLRRLLQIGDEVGHAGGIAVVIGEAHAVGVFGLRAAGEEGDGGHVVLVHRLGHRQHVVGEQGADHDVHILLGDEAHRLAGRLAGLARRVGQHQLQLGAAHALDAAPIIDGLHQIFDRRLGLAPVGGVAAAHGLDHAHADGFLRHGRRGGRQGHGRAEHGRCQFLQHCVPPSHTGLCRISHRPRKAAFLFSLKAFTPSSKSAEPNAVIWA